MNQMIMKEVENCVKTSVVKKFAIMHDKIDKVLELIDKLEQTTCTEVNEIKSLLYQVRNETRVCTSQQTHTMPVHEQPSFSASDSETKGKLAGPQLIKSSDCKTSAEKSKPSKTMLQKPHRTLDVLSVASQSLDQSNESRLDKLSASKPSLTNSETLFCSRILAIEQSQPTKTILNPSIAHVQASSSTSDTESKHAAQQKINFSDSKTDVPHEISQKLSSPFVLAAELSKSTKTVLKPPTEHEHPQFTKRRSGHNPSLLHALKRLHASIAISKSSEPPKTMPQDAAATAVPVESISVTSLKENQRQNLTEQIIESSESSHQNTSGAPQQKSQEVVADLSICHPELLDLSESYTSTFTKSSEITGTQQKLIHDIQNETANEYILPSNPIKKDEYDSILSSSKPEPYNGLFDFSSLKISATSTPVRRQRPVPLPRSGSKKSSVTNINVPSVYH